MARGGLYVAGHSLGVDHDLVVGVAMAAGFTLRVLAIRYNCQMPKFVHTQDLH